MSVALVGLVPRLRLSLTVPGAPSLFTFDDTTEGDWTLALANAFWNARLAGLFPSYRAAPDGLTVEPIAPETDELPEEVQQVLVVWAALTAIEMRFAVLANTRSKAGPLEFEQSRPATLLKALLDARRAELEEIKDDLLDGSADGSASTSVTFIDLAVVRHTQIVEGCGYWVN